jgi:SulP family sulfate permease
MKIANAIHFRNLQGDFLGGLTAAIVALPMALAFGVASGAGPQAGLYCAVFLGFFAVLFGGTPTLISNPTGPMTVVFTAVFMNFTAVKDGVPVYENGLAMAFTVVMLAGLFQILFGVLKLGKFVTLMPYTVISGFMSGIGFIMILLQVAPFLGTKNEGGIVGAITNLPKYIENANWAAIILASMTLAIILLMPAKLKKYAPPQLIALVFCTILSVIVFPNSGLARIGDNPIPMGFEKLYIPYFQPSEIKIMVIDGLMLGMLGCIDSLLTSVIADSITQTQHDSDKELIGQGLGNIISGVFGGLPGAGATMGTVVNIQAGGRTILSGMIHSVILLVVLLGAAPLTEPIPNAVLAGILVKVGIDIVDWNFLKRAHKLSLRAAAIMYGVLGLTVFVDLIIAVGAGVFIANILTIDKLSAIQAEKVKAISDPEEAEHLASYEKSLLRQAKGQILLMHLGGPMSFGAAKAISQRQSIMQDYKILILDITDVPLLGVTATLALESLVAEAKKKDLEIFIAGGADKVKTRLEKFSILAQIPADHQKATCSEALEEALNHLGLSQVPVDAAP